MTRPSRERQAFFAGLRLRQAHERLLAAIAKGEALPGDLAILSAVVYFTVGWGKCSDHLYLSQIAVHAGRWQGEPRECPKHVRDYIGRRMKVLDALDVVEYLPGRGRGVPAKITLPVREKSRHGGDEFLETKSRHGGDRKVVSTVNKSRNGGDALPRVEPEVYPTAHASAPAGADDGALDIVEDQAELAALVARSEAAIERGVVTIDALRAIGAAAADGQLSVYAVADHADAVARLLAAAERQRDAERGGGQPRPARPSAGPDHGVDAA